MPTYSYKCSSQDCEGTKELSTSMSNRDAWQGKECPTCGNGTLRRSFTPYSILNAGLGDIL